MIKAIIIEDESKSRALLQSLVEKHCEGVEIVGAAENVKSGIALIKEKKPDLLFLDVAMPDGTGFDVLEAVKEQNFEIIFTTAFDEYAMKAIKYSALDYLLKPIDLDELQEAVKKLKERGEMERDKKSVEFLLENVKEKKSTYSKITLPTGNAYEIVNVKDIVRCEADGNYTKFFLTDKRRLLISNSMKHYEELLPENDFIRVHHSHLININHVLRYVKTDGGFVVMSDESEVEISRRKKDAFLQYLENIS